jgi:hypothetical protein
MPELIRVISDDWYDFPDPKYSPPSVMGGVSLGQEIDESFCVKVTVIPRDSFHPHLPPVPLIGERLDPPRAQGVSVPCFHTVLFPHLGL